MAPNFGKPPALKEQFCARQLQFQSWWARRLPRNLQRFGNALAGLSVATHRSVSRRSPKNFECRNIRRRIGAIFDSKSCAKCHPSPSVGGGGRIVVTRFGRVENDKLDPLEPLGDSSLQRQAINPAVRGTMPHEANVASQRLSTPLFGLFLLYYKMCIALVSGDSTTIVDTYAIGGGSVAQLSRLFATAGVVVNHRGYQSLATDSQLYPQGVLTSKKSRDLGYVSAFLSSGTDKIKIIIELKIELAWAYFL